ncbi:hypothetical protein JG688_00015422 [Phytophthora aleatoria]|uniref:GAF domain-containing protein n=1 Tax=Phytophthora aleatoria TaxID=2496075 RepID=A0A8J5MDF0_9STRA|nr:hypothetical protein JG688_00015422 [Phytophthora aleatoria]
MNLSWVRDMLKEARKGWSGSPSSDDSTIMSSPTPTISTQSDDDNQQEVVRPTASLSDQEMLDRARAAHDNEDFRAMSAGPEANGPWKRVEAAGRFVVFRREVKASSNEKRPNELEAMCAGRLDASLEEVASILRSSSEGEHNAAMAALYAKDFIFGSYERDVPYPGDNQNETDDHNHEELSVKTQSFARTAMFANNEQWCYFDYFQRKKERDGFTISMRALPPTESTPGRILGQNARVDQLHGLSTSYLVDKLPNRKGLRVVFHAWFDLEESTDKRKNSRRRSHETTSSNTSSSPNLRRHSFPHGDSSKYKAHLQQMESSAGRVAAITVCTRCHVNVEACEYSEVFAGTAEEREKHRGPPRVIEDANDTSTVLLLVDFLSASLLNTSSGSVEHAAAMDVIRVLLRQDSDDEDSDEEYDDNNECEQAPRFKEMEAVEKIREILSDEHQLPNLEACKLGNAEQRNYLLDLPDDPNIDVPRSPIPSNEAERIASIKSAGLLDLADIFAPEIPRTDVKVNVPDVHDLELLCQLAVKTLGCAYAFVTIMTTKHEHIVVGTHPGFVGAAVPRAQTTCQHALMSPYPFMTVHHEADVRFHKYGAISAVPTRFYAGFPLTVPIVGGKPEDDEMTVGMLCCIDSKPRAEITRTQYATMKRLASTSSHFLLQKSRRLHQHIIATKAP